MDAQANRSPWNVVNLNSPWHKAALACCVAIVCYATTKLGPLFAIGPKLDWALWLGNAFLASILLVVPRRMWIALIAAAFSAYIVNDIQVGLSIGSIAWLVLSDTVEVLTAVLCLSYVFGGVPRLNNLRALAKFSLFAVILTPCVAASLALFTSSGDKWTSWKTSFFSEAIVYLSLMPAILGWFSQRPAGVQKQRVYYIEAAALIAGLAVIGYLAFAAPRQYSSEAMLYFLVPFLIWSALRFGSTGVSTSAITIAVLAIWGTTHGRGPFIDSGAGNSVSSMQLFLFFTTAPFMVLAAIVEENKQASEQLFRSIFENAQIGISFYKIDTQEIFPNRSLQQMLGHTVEELGTLEKWDQITHPDDRDSCAQRYNTLVLGNREKDEWEQRLVRKDGRIVITNVRFFLLRDAAGRPQYVAALQEDITERREAEALVHKRDEELKNANFLAETALELAKAGYWHVPLDGSGWYNSSARRVAIFGDIPRADFRYRIDEMFSHAAEGDAAAAAAARKTFDAAVKSSSVPYNVVYAYKRPVDGKIAWIHALGHVVKDQAGKPTDMYGVSQDITEFKCLEAELLRAKEAAETATKAKSEFLANMSHEIRTPMNAILGMTHLALRTALAPKQRDYLAKTKAAAEGLLGIINDILDFSKIEAGKLTMEHTEFRLDLVLEHLSTVVTPKVCEKNLEFLIDQQHDLPSVLVGDQLRLGQVLINLVNNAVKFTERGEVVVSVKFEERLADRVKLRFDVRDSGIGMTPEQVARLFQAFSQGDSSTTRKHGGTGLGLSISKRLVEMMEGRIWVESEYGCGSTFSFTSWFGISTAEESPKRIPLGLTNIRALIANDNALARQILVNALKQFLSRVDSVSSIEAALRELATADQEDPYQLILMDSQLSTLNGFQASRIIKRGGSLKNVPKIIVISAFDREEVQGQAEEIGIEAVLQKPVSQSALLDTLLNIFGVAAKENVQSTAGGLGVQSPDARGVRVLLVEDNELNQQIATELLESVGASVTVANHGGEAVSLFPEGDQPPFDVVFMDVQMPEMDGFTATRILRARPSLSKLPIIAMTAHAMSNEIQHCLNEGMSDHVGKPIDPSVLFAALARWTQGRERKISAPPAKLAKTADIFSLPEMEGVDLTIGLQRVAGNKVLYRDLLTQFVAKQASAPRRIMDAFASGDYGRAEQLVHSLKGVAGNLGIEPIFNSAANVERALREPHAKTAELLEDLASVVDRQISAIKGTLPVANMEGTQALEGRPLDVAKVLPALAQLKQLLEASDADASETYRNLATLLRGSVDALRLSALGEAVGSFNFEVALNRLEELVKQFEVKEKLAE